MRMLIREDGRSDIHPAKFPDDPAPPGKTHQRPELRSDYVAPGNETERKIADIWSQLLGLDRVGIHDDFFELGGDSLLGTRVLVRLKEMFGTELTLHRLFQNPTVHDMAEQIRAIRKATRKLENSPEFAEGDWEEGEL